MRMLSGLVAAMCLLAGGANAEVVERTEAGFRLKKIIEVAAPPAKAYAALGQIGAWWSDDHTYTGKASNMSLELKPGACFCETLPGGGGVRHGVVAMAWPDQHTLRLDAALGPLQNEGVAGALTFQIKPKATGSVVTVTYHIGGMRAASTKAYADLVDQVISTQVARYGKFVDTGKPN